MSPSPRDSDRLLFDALAAAGVTAPDAEAAPPLELFCLRVGGAAYGIEPGLVHEVILTPPITALPGAPAFLVGVIAHRGEVLAVVDLALLLGRGETPRTERSRLAIARFDGMSVGLLAERISGLARFDASARSAAPLGAAGTRAFVAGVVVSEPGPAVNVLDLQRALGSVREQALARR